MTHRSDRIPVADRPTGRYIYFGRYGGRIEAVRRRRRLRRVEAVEASWRYTDRYRGVPTDTEVYRSVRPSMIPSVCHSVPTVRIGTYRTDQLSVHRYGTVLRTLVET
ncbi:unnamed protein product [Musa textilis]